MKKSVITIALIMLLLFAGCGRTEQAEETSPTLPVAENTTISESTTISDKETSESETTVKQNSNSETTKPAEQKSAGQTTSKKVTTTQKQTNTQRQTTTRKQTTTQNVTTTQKQTTTKKVTTTEDEWNCNVDGHTSNAGQIGWLNSYEEAVNKARNYIDQNADSGGYRIEQCHMCGKYTAYITLD